MHVMYIISDNMGKLLWHQTPAKVDSNSSCYILFLLFFYFTSFNQLGTALFYLLIQSKLSLKYT